MSTNPFDSDLASPTPTRTKQPNPFDRDFAQEEYSPVVSNREPVSPPNASQWNSSGQYHYQQQHQEHSSAFKKYKQKSQSQRYAQQNQYKKYDYTDDTSMSESQETKYPNSNKDRISSNEREKRYTETYSQDKNTTPQSGWRTRYGVNERSDNYDGSGGGGTFASQTKQQSRYRSELDDDNNSGEDLYGTSRFADDEGEQEVDRLKQNIRNVKQETLDSTRTALQTIHATQDTAGQTLANLNEQAGQIGSIDRDLGVAKEQAEEAAQKTKYLKRLNRSIFLPAWKNPFNKKARERQRMEQEQLAHAEALDDRDKTRQFEYESQTRMQRAQQRMNNNSDSSAGTSGRSQADRNRYQFEANAEDDAMEDEIDQNLNLLSSATKNLKQMANTMGEEIDSQNRHLEKVVDKVNPVNERLFSTTQQLNKIK